jgi:four helix bundle protein
MRDFRKLKAWNKAHELCLAIYVATRHFSVEERYGLTSQMRRAASAISANIAEGCGHSSERELARYCDIAAASSSELEYHLLLARDLGMLEEASYRNLNEKTNEVKRMLNAFISTLRAGNKNRNSKKTNS